MNKAQEIISRVMIKNGYRHKYQVAEYFGVTPQAISTWLTKGEVPSKHLLKVRTEIQPPNIPDPQEPSTEDRKTVIDYLINENVRLKKEISNLKLKFSKINTDSNDDLLSKLNSRSLVLKGRVSDGMITDVGGDWYKLLGYQQSDLINHKYDEGFIHKEDTFKIQQNQVAENNRNQNNPLNPEIAKDNSSEKVSKEADNTEPNQIVHAIQEDHIIGK